MFKKINVRVNGTEWDFISNLISQLEEAGLECLTDKQALQTAMESNIGDAIPVEFQCGIYKVVMTRNTGYSNPTNLYLASVVYDDVTLYTITFDIFAGTASVTTVRERSMGMFIFLKADVINIVIYNHANTLKMEVFAISLNDEICYSCSTAENTCAIQNALTAVKSRSIYTVHNTMAFSHNDLNKMLYIAGKMFVSGGIYAATYQSLIDCTNVTPRTVITIDDQLYYALSANTLLAVENE